MAEKLYGLTENKAWKEIPEATVDSEVTVGGTNAVSGAAVAAYAVNKSGDTMTGALIASETSAAELAVVQVRNAVILDTDPGEGTASDYPDGTLVFVREVSES